MTYDHTATRLHQADLDRDIESLRTERLLAAATGPTEGVSHRARRRLGGALIAIGTALVGQERRTLRTHRA